VNTREGARTTTGTTRGATRKDAAKAGMLLALVAREDPRRLAIASPAGDRSFGALNARANQLVRALRHRGLQAGDSVALVCSNRPEFAVAVYAALRGGFRLTPLNWHLTASEMAYILEDCEAQAFLADGRFATRAVAARRELPELSACLSIGDPIPAFQGFDDALAEQPGEDIADPQLGSTMLYTSGTTGRPKGVYRRSEPQRRPGIDAILKRIAYRPGEDLHLCTGPLYHAAPLAFSLTMPLNLGVGVVLMDGFDPLRTLELIAGYRVTHTHMVPTMFHRLLALPEEERERYDLSSLRMVLHGAAPCPVSVKQALIEWLGPVVYEYYAATEGWGSFVTPEEWLARPGTVGRPRPGEVEIRDEEGKPQPPGKPGTIYLAAPELGRFEYFKDPEKTGRAYAGDAFTLGDVGYLDDEGYLFLCDRSADVIISGGVNVYPAEVDAVLLAHRGVADAATVGAPDDEWGEVVVSIVALREGLSPSAELAEELLELCRTRLAHYKCPRRIEFRDRLPRRETGKLLRRVLRDELWAGRERRI
jgi:long-chain acyl-CoA synthetase